MVRGLLTVHEDHKKEGTDINFLGSAISFAPYDPEPSYIDIHDVSTDLEDDGEVRKILSRSAL